MNSPVSSPLARLRHHVSGAIARGEAQAVTEIRPTAHTPGPWAVRGLAGLYCRDIAIHESAHAYPVALAVSRRSYTPYGAADRSMQETEANARLIASAPDLLAALAGCADALREAGKDFAQANRLAARPNLYELHEQAARAAITKAKGEAL